MSFWVLSFEATNENVLRFAIVTLFTMKLNIFECLAFGWLKKITHIIIHNYDSFVRVLHAVRNNNNSSYSSQACRQSMKPFRFSVWNRFFVFLSNIFMHIDSDIWSHCALCFALRILHLKTRPQWTMKERKIAWKNCRRINVCVCVSLMLAQVIKLASGEYYNMRLRRHAILHKTQNSTQCSMALQIMKIVASSCCNFFFSFRSVNFMYIIRSLTCSCYFTTITAIRYVPFFIQHPANTWPSKFSGNEFVSFRFFF